MNKNLRECRRGRTASPLYRKFLMLLLMMVVGVSQAWGEETSLGKVSVGSEITANSADWQYIGNNNSITGAFVKGTAEKKQIGDNYFVKLTSEGIVKLRVTKGSVSAGDILRVDVGPSGDSSQNLGYIVEGSNSFVQAGEGTYTSNQVVSYILKASDIQNDPDAENTDMIVINRSGGGYAYAYHSFEILSNPYTVTFSANDASLGTVTATYNGNEITSGYHVPAGSQVSFTATPSGTNLMWGWDGTDGRKYDGNKTVTINSDYNIVAQFTAGVLLNANTNDASLGTVKVVAGSQEGTSLRVTPYPYGGVKFVATPIDNNIFNGWYKESTFENQLTTEKEYNTPDEGDMNVTNQSEYNLYAKFTKGYMLDVNVEPSTIDPSLDIYFHDHKSDWSHITNHAPLGEYTNVEACVENVDGYKFDGWYVGDEKKSSDLIYNYGSLTSDLTITAKFKVRGAVDGQPIGGQRIKATLENIGTGNLDTNNDGNVVTGVWEDGVLQTSATSYNHVDIFQFGSGKNVPTSASDYSGIRFHADAKTAFRVIIYGNSTVIRTFQSGNKEYVFTWDELGISASDVAGITRICFAGQQGGSTDVTFSNVWIEKIDDPCHTIVCYDHDTSKFSFDDYTYTYNEATPEGNVTAVFSDIDGSSRRDVTNEIILENSLVITAPQGKSLKAVKLITDAKATELVFTGLGKDANAAVTRDCTDGYTVIWTQDNVQSVTITNADADSKKARIAKIEVVYDNGNVKQPALARYGETYGQFVADLSMIAGGDRFAYDDEDNTVYNSNSSAYAGNFCINFETGYDLSSLSKIAVGYTGEQLVDFVDIFNGDTRLLSKYGVDLSNITFTDEDREKLETVTRINFAAQGERTGAMHLEYIGFDMTHVAPKVALNEGIETVYEITAGETITLSAHVTAGENGTGSILWEDYESTSASDPKPEATRRINPYYHASIDFTPTTADLEKTYYFGARAIQNCSDNHTSGGYTLSAPVFVTVKVVKKAINEELDLAFNYNNSQKNRKYRVYVPAVVAGENKTLPVVFSLHGAGNNDDPTQGGLQNFNTIAENTADPFVVIYPQGRSLNFPGHGGTSTGWEATGVENEDTRFFREIINDLKKNTKFSGFTVNDNRIYITGFSNGGMMTYAAANCMSDVFASYAAIAGYPINEMHLQHNGKRAVPFMHVHGTNDGVVTPANTGIIVDNMLARNGLSYTPSATETGDNYTKYTYSADGKKPYIFYSVSGMWHVEGFNLTTGNSSRTTQSEVWNFLRGYNLSKQTTTSQFAPQSIDANHGWVTSDAENAKLIARYGESKGLSNNNNVYHSIQLTYGVHWLSFTPNNTDASKKVKVRLKRLATLNHFNSLATDGFEYDYTASETNKQETNEVLFERIYTCAEPVSFSFDINKSEGYECMLEFEKMDASDATTISAVSIASSGTESGVKADQGDWANNVHGYFYNPNTRMAAQWNFDACDGYRFNVNKLSSAYWTKSTTEDPNVDIWTYTQAIKGTSDNISDESAYAELYYDPATKNEKIAVTSGLKFRSDAGHIKIEVVRINGVQRQCYLIVDENVKMLVPYVENTYRNDVGDNNQPRKNDEFDNTALFNNCPHHWKRDILYISYPDGSDMWDHIVNECIDDASKSLFNPGGSDFVNDHHFYKYDYFGNYGVPCVLQFRNETKIDRMNVNRNLTFSYYSEYINDYGADYATPKPGTRIVGSPHGQKVANITDVDTDADYQDAIAMTYGGWLNSDGESTYKMYGENTSSIVTVTDRWSDLAVYNGNKAMTWADMALPENAATAYSDVPIASDGFPVVALLNTPARSELLNVDQADVDKYHPISNGEFVTTYTANQTPWTLPCRGGYVKFEPTLPGVLNVHLLMHAGDVYYIADEFGKLVTDNIFTKSGSDDNKVKRADQNGNFNDSGIGFKLYSTKTSEASTKSDYVKFSFNVSPGKTYYMFSNTYGMGVAGFYYEPFVQRIESTASGYSSLSDYEKEYGREDVGVRYLSLGTSASDSYAYPDNVTDKDGNSKPIISDETLKSPTNAEKTEFREYPIHYSNKAVKVTLQGRTFKKDNWNTICLPYSMNQVQIDKVFGEGTKLVLLRDVQDRNPQTGNRTAHFIYHQHKDIIAGYPYFIRPTKTVENPTSYACIQDKNVNNGIPELVYIESNAFGGMTGYQFRGNFQREFYTNGSYYVAADNTLKCLNGTKDGQSLIKNDGKTYKGNFLNPYRVRMESYLDEDLNPKSSIKAYVVDEDGEEEIDTELSTAIEDIMFEEGVVGEGTAVYDMSGKKVSNDGNLNNLPKGIYIVNGKKFISK